MSMNLSDEEREELEKALPNIIYGLKQMLGLPEDITLAELHERNRIEYPKFIARMEARKLQIAKDELLAMEIANARKEEERRDKLC